MRSRRAKRGSQSSAPSRRRADGTGGGAFREVVLHPVVTVAEEGMVDAAYAAHRQANAWCFIANSVNFPVRHEATVRVAA